MATNLHKKGGRERMGCGVGDRQGQQKSVLADSLVFLPVRAYHNLLEISGELVLETCNPLLYRLQHGLHR